MEPKNKTQKKLVAKLTWTLVAVACVAGGLSWADVPERLAGKKQDLDIQLNARKVVRQGDGAESMESAQRAFPGEVIQYDARYSNLSGHVLGRVAPTLPIPQGMVFLPASAQPAPAEASLDGKTFQPIPIKRQVPGPNGGTVEEEVSPTEYRVLRWHLGDLAVGAVATVSARTRVVGVNQP